MEVGAVGSDAVGSAGAAVGDGARVGEGRRVGRGVGRGVGLATEVDVAGSRLAADVADDRTSAVVVVAGLAWEGRVGVADDARAALADPVVVEVGADDDNATRAGVGINADGSPDPLRSDPAAVAAVADATIARARTALPDVEV